uniref:C-type lectin domain-containing protein n=1 Tax=Syphacia muris TaxID=451379 RepID=A0A0N5AI12_9BILA
MAIKLRSVFLLVLASIVLQSIKGFVKKSKKYYIGLEWQKNGWHWCDGRPVTYTNWMYPPENPDDGSVVIGGCGTKNNRWRILTTEAEKRQPRSAVCKRSGDSETSKLLLNYGF